MDQIGFKRYIVEVHDPDDPEAVIATFDSDAPFLGINRGDLISSMTLSLPNGNPNERFEIVGVEHQIYGVNPTHHKLDIYIRGPVWGLVWLPKSKA